MGENWAELLQKTQRELAEVIDECVFTEHQLAKERQRRQQELALRDSLLREAADLCRALLSCAEALATSPPSNPCKELSTSDYITDMRDCVDLLCARMEVMLCDSASDGEVATPAAATTADTTTTTTLELLDLRARAAACEKTVSKLHSELREERATIERQENIIQQRQQELADAKNVASSQLADCDIVLQNLVSEMEQLLKENEALRRSR